MPVSLTVDGIAVSLRDTIRIFQRDPHPGGHSYVLIVRGARELALFRGVDLAAPLTSSVQRDLLYTIDRLAGLEAGEVPAAFVLNTVELVSRVGEELQIAGVCSTVLDGGEPSERPGLLRQSMLASRILLLTVTVPLVVLGLFLPTHDFGGMGDPVLDHLVSSDALVVATVVTAAAVTVSALLVFLCLRSRLIWVAGVLLVLSGSSLWRCLSYYWLHPERISR